MAMSPFDDLILEDTIFTVDTQHTNEPWWGACATDLSQDLQSTSVTDKPLKNTCIYIHVPIPIPIPTYIYIYISLIIDWLSIMYPDSAVEYKSGLWSFGSHYEILTTYIFSSHIHCKSFNTICQWSCEVWKNKCMVILITYMECAPVTPVHMRYEYVLIMHYETNMY